MFWVIVAVLIAAAGAAFWYRASIAKILPGMKHGIAGWLTAATSFVLAVAEYFRTIDLSTLMSPAKVTLISMGLGLLILVLSWVTPRRD